jgi:hypothetical protein
MFEKEIILEEELAARCLFQCSPARKSPANANQRGHQNPPTFESWGFDSPSRHQSNRTFPILCIVAQPLDYAQT